MPDEVPSAVTARCPDCDEETLHTVLRGRQSSTSAQTTLDATVQCTECERVHHVLVREAAPVAVPAIVSRGNESRKTTVQLAADEQIDVGEAMIVDGLNCKLTGIEDVQGRRVEGAAVKDIRSLWLKEFESLLVKFAINLDHKTITKHIEAKPEEEFSVGAEHVFGRLRVTVHAIKTEERLLKRGTAEAGEIVRIFASPTALARKPHRPDKRERAQLREREDRRAARRGDG